MKLPWSTHKRTKDAQKKALVMRAFFLVVSFGLRNDFDAADPDRDEP